MNDSDSLVISGKKALEESPCCRVCHGESEPDNQLFYPCKCDGSIRYVHQDCLVQWLKVSKQNKGKCELCGEKFQFQNVYAVGAPTRLTIFEVIMELMPRIVTISKTVLYVIISSFFWGVCLPLFTNWWIRLCWCVVSETNFGTCSLSILPLVDSVEHAMMAWYSGIVNICVIVAVSVLFFEMVQIVYREFDMAERNRNMRQLERQLNDNFAGLRLLEEERRLGEARQMAVSEYEALRFEWDLAKQTLEKKSSISSALQIPSSQVNEASIDGERKEDDFIATDVEKEEDSCHEGISDVEKDEEKLSLLFVSNEKSTNDTADLTSDNVDEEGTDALLVASLRIDILYTTRMLVLLDEVCEVPGLEYFVALRDCYRQVNALLVRHVGAVDTGCSSDGVIEGLVADPDLQDIVLQRLQETNNLSSSLCAPSLLSSSSENMTSARRARLLLEASQSLNGPSAAAATSRAELTIAAAESDDTALSLEARGRLMMQRYNEKYDRERREVAEFMTSQMEDLVDKTDIVGDDGSGLDNPDALREFDFPEDVERVLIASDTVIVEEEVVDDEVVDVDEEEAIYLAERSSTHDTICGEKEKEDQPDSSTSSNSMDRTTHGPDIEEIESPDDVPVVVAEFPAPPVVPAVVDPALELIGQVAVIEPAAPLVAGRDAGAVNNAAHNEAAQMQLGIKYLLMCFSFVALFVLLLLVLPAFMGRLLFEGSVVPDAVKARARTIIQSVLDRENVGHLLTAKLMGHDLDGSILSSDSALSAETRTQIAEAVYLKFKTIVEILVGYGMYVALFVLGYSLYCVRYLRAVRNVRLPSASAFLAAQTVNAQKGLLALSKLSMMLGFYGMVLPLTVATLVSKTIARSVSPSFSVTLQKFLSGGATDDPSSEGFEIDPMIVIYAVFLYFFAFVFMAHVLVIALELRQLVRKDLLVDFLPKNDPFERRNRVAGAAVGGGGGQAVVAAIRQANANHANNINVRVNLNVVNGQQLPQLVLNPANQPLPPNPLQRNVDELQDSLAKVSYARLLQKFLTNATILVPSVLVGVILPLRIGHFLCPLLPSDGPLLFRFKSVVMDVQVPVEMVLSHILVPMLLEKMRYKHNIRRLLAWFLSVAAPLLGLHWIMAPEAFPTPAVVHEVLPVLQVGNNVPVAGVAVERPVAPPLEAALAPPAEQVLPETVTDMNVVDTRIEDNTTEIFESDSELEMAVISSDMEELQPAETHENVSTIDKLHDITITEDVIPDDIPVPAEPLSFSPLRSESSDSSDNEDGDCDVDMKSVSSQGGEVVVEEEEKEVEDRFVSENLLFDAVAVLNQVDISNVTGEQNEEVQKAGEVAERATPGATQDMICADEMNIERMEVEDTVVMLETVRSCDGECLVGVDDDVEGEATAATAAASEEPHEIVSPLQVVAEVPVVQPDLPDPLTDTTLATALPVEARVGLLVLLGMVLFAVVSSWVLHLPLFVGRQLMSLCRIPPTNDLFNYPAGLVVCWAGSFVLEYVYKDLVHNADAASFVQVVVKWAARVAKILALGAVWLLVPPMAVGLFVEVLFIIPMRTPLNESPQYPFLQCWAIGLIIFKVWTRCVLTGMFGDIPLRLQFEQILIRGFAQFDATTTLFKVVLPVTATLLDYLLVPYFLARVACLFVQSYLLRTVLVRFSIHIYIVVRVLIFAVCHVYIYLTTLHNELRDSRYLIGTKLTNREKVGATATL